MFKTMLVAGVICAAASCSLIAETVPNVPAARAARSTAASHPAKALAPTLSDDVRAFTTLHFAIRGRTATWAFSFTCEGAHCSFHNTHHLHDVDNPGYVAIAAVFDDETSPQPEAVVVAPQRALPSM